MQAILFEDISKRLSRRNSPPNTNLINMREAQLFTNNGVFCKNNAIESIKNWESLAESVDEAFEKALDIFEMLCENANESTIRTSCDILVENVDKVRDQTQLANSLKYRMGIMRKKVSTKVGKEYSEVSDKIQAAIDSFKKPTASVPRLSAPSIVKTTNECFERLYDRCLMIRECDRILENYASISRRFNLDRIVNNICFDTDSYQACIDIAACVDTYNIPFKNKYNSALETAAYAFDKHHMNYPKDRIVEAVTDYFIFTGAIKEEQLQDMIAVMNISVIFEQSDFTFIQYMLNECENESDRLMSVDECVLSYGENYSALNEVDLSKAAKNAKKEIRAKKKELKQVGKDLKKAAKDGNPEEHRDEDIKKMVDEFRAQCMKDKNSKTNLPSFKSLIAKIFSKSPYQIVYELPNLFSIARAIFVLGSLSIDPFIGIIAFIGNEILKVYFSRKQLTKAITAYNNEIKTVKSKIEAAKDKNTKENLEKYLNQLEKDLKKIEEYEHELYTEEENDKRDEEKYASGDIDDDDDFDFDDEDWELDDFDEAASIVCISNYMESISECLLDSNVNGIVYNNIFKFSNDSLDDLADFSITVPVVLERRDLIEALIQHRQQLRDKASSTSDYIRIDCINENILKLENAMPSYNTSISARDAMYYLACISEICKLNTEGYVNEMEFSNTVRLAINNLKRNAIKLSDKEKQVSNSIDVAANNVSKGLEKAMMNGSREAVLRGSIIPSASKCIKLALGIGAAWAINPAIAVISAIGGFACSKKLQAKERQLVLDDIEIELKMVDRYIKQAEDENDMQKIRQYEIIQRNLERQKQRIKYKMVTVYNQKVPEVKDED